MRSDPWLSPALSMTQFKEETMLVHPVVIPGSGTRSWTVLGDDDVPVVPVDRFLAYLTDIGRSPNTVKAYAHDMKDLWQFLGFRGLDWREARLEDIGAAEQEITIVARENANGARAKSGGRTVPAGPELIRLYAGYLHEEYGGIDSDYVFVNIWAEPKGQAWSYQAAYDLVLRLRARTGIAFDPHWFRHSAATRWLRDGVPIEVVSTLLGHLP